MKIFCKHAFVFLFISMIHFHANAFVAPVVLSSPDKAIHAELKSESGKIYYTVTYNNIIIIEPSQLSMVVDGKELIEGNLSANIENYKLNETYPYRGVHSMAINKCNGARINIEGNNGAAIEMRVYNDGIAFCYHINRTGLSVVNEDNTQFVISANSTVWSQNNIKYYEGRYGKKKIEDFKEGDLAGPPVTVELSKNAGYLAITEGGLTDFAGMSLIIKGSRSFKANLTGTAKQTGNFHTPWRIIEIGKDLNTLVNCDIVANVSPRSDIKLFPKVYATDWVKPGRSVWSWLANNRSITLENMKHFTDLAAQLGFEYNLVDEGWSKWKDSANGKDQWDMMKELVDYSATKGVKIWVWKAYPDRGGIPGINTPEKRMDFFKRCKELGIAGLKIDFFDSESQEIIQFYQAALHDAAEYHLMIDFHGADKPTGESRTWPNEMTREAIRGMENQAPWALGNTTLPFTRYLAGPADFTPVHFGNRLGEISWAHHVASMVVFTSPFLCLGADPQTVLENPAKEMIQSIPSTWDETIVLTESKIGELVLYARRNGNTWFVAAMNGQHQIKNITIPLSFLKKGNYTLYTGKDDPEKQSNIIIEKKNISATDTITITLNAEGGFIGRITKN